MFSSRSYARNSGVLHLTYKRQPHKMVKHTQTIHWQKPTNCLSVYDQFWRLKCEFQHTFLIFSEELNTLIYTYAKKQLSSTMGNLLVKYIWCSSFV